MLPIKGDIDLRVGSSNRAVAIGIRKDEEDPDVNAYFNENRPLLRSR